MLHTLGFLGLGTTEIIVLLVVLLAIPGIILAIVFGRKNKSTISFPMKKYYLHDGANQVGPFDVEDLRMRNVTRTTPVWYSGLADWKHAHEIPELSPLFASTGPPPFNGINPNPPAAPPQYRNQPQQQPKKKSSIGLIITLGALLLLVVIGAVVVINNPNSIPGMKLEINTPKPKVVTSRANQGKSGVFNARTTVYATVSNNGGDGNVLVTFYVYQGNETYDRTQNIYMRAGDSQDLEETFEEVDYLSGDITYNVDAEAQ